MRTSILSAIFAASVALFASGCAAESSSTDDTSASDLTSLDGTHADVLSDALTKAKAPSNVPAATLGVSSHVARITLATAQGGMAHFISQSGSMSTADGQDLGDLVDLGIAWTPVKDALVAGGAKFTTVAGANGASSSTLVAEVECKQAIAPSARPGCTVTPITMTASDNAALMTALVNVGAPNTAQGLGTDDLVGKLELTTAQGGMAHFISEGAELSTLDGSKKLGDLGTIDIEWKSLETALLDAGLAWKTENGAHGASSSTMDASVECHRVVAPQARATCTVSAL